jgi:predicted dehydrogenase
MRQAAYRIQAGQLGTVKEVHVWTNRPVWDQGKDRPPAGQAPKEVDWESWIGPAPYRPYAEGVYHAFQWRGWWDFGTGSLGDMACHTCNLPFMALNMKNPTSVEASSSGHNQDSYPERSKIKFEFPALDKRAAFTLYWSDKSQLPPEELYAEFLKKPGADGNSRSLAGSGCLIVGDKATMYAAGDYAQEGIELNNDVEWLDVDFPKAPGSSPSSDNTELSHVTEFYDAIRGSKVKPMSNIPDYSGPLTETILLGNLSVWHANKADATATVKWDAKNLTPDDPSLMAIVKPKYRDGYEV